MKEINRIFWTGLLAMLLSACSAPPQRIAMTPAVKQKLAEVKILSLVPQDEMIVRAEAFGASAALGGGLIGAVIDSKVAESRQNTLQDVMAPFYQAVDDYDFRTRYERALGSALLNDTGFKFAALESTTVPPMVKDLTDRVSNMPANTSLMFVRTSYTFTADFTRINMLTYVEMKMPGSDEPVFKNSFLYQSQPVGNGGPDSVKQWAGNMGASYRAFMDEGAAETIKMLQFDLAAPLAETKPAPTVSIDVVNGTTKTNVTGPVLVSSAARTVVRHPEGNVFSLPK